MELFNLFHVKYLSVFYELGENAHDKTRFMKLFNDDYIEIEKNMLLNPLFYNQRNKRNIK